MKTLNPRGWSVFRNPVRGSAEYMYICMSPVGSSEDVPARQNPPSPKVMALVTSQILRKHVGRREASAMNSKPVSASCPYLSTKALTKQRNPYWASPERAAALTMAGGGLQRCTGRGTYRGERERAR